MADDAKSLETGLTALFIRRPVLAFVLNTLIAVAGLAAFYGVEIRELPDVDRAVVTVTTEFQGAAAETVDRELTDTIEGAVARVSGVKSISSTSSFGQSRVTIEFNDGVDLNVAASDVRDAVGRVANLLPEEAEAPRIVKADANSDAVMRLAVTSQNMSVEDMTIVVEDQIEDELAAVPGVADVQVYGDREKIFRIDVDQRKLASLGYTVADLRNALASVAFETPAGSITTRNQDLIVRTTADVTTPEQFGDIVIGGETKIRDVATVTLGGDISRTSLRSDGKTGIGIGIIRAAESNTLDISDGVRAAVDQIRPNLPAGMNIKVTSDDAVFVRGAVHEVEIALALSVSIVLLVIYVFLLDWRATLIPALSMPVAMIGTVAAIYLAGFSINILTLLALVLATGLVVDDAIVVLENIVRRRNQGLGPRAAAVLGTQEVFFAVIATTATLIAVFVPISFLPGQTGGLFREFGFVLAISVALSCVVALTLCPMLASRMLTEAAIHHDHGAVGRLGSGLLKFYRRALHACLDAPLIVVMVAVLFAGAAFALFGTIRQELTPSEDRSVVLLRISAPQGVSLDYTAGADAPHRGPDPADARRRRDRGDLPERRPERQLQLRLHGHHAGALGRAQPLAAGDHRRHHPARPPGAQRARLPGHAQQPRHPRRRQRPAVRACRQRPQEAQRGRRQDDRRHERRSALRAAAPLGRPHPAAAGGGDRPRPRLGPRHRHHPACRHGAGHARRQRHRRRLYRRPRLWREAGLDHQSHQRPDRPRECLPEDEATGATCRCRPSPR